MALPRGCGTLEELFEAITWKRLGMFLGPIVLVNIDGFFDPCVQLLSRCIEEGEEGFMDERHSDMWSVVAEPEQIVGALRTAPPWNADARSFAVLL